MCDAAPSIETSRMRSAHCLVALVPWVAACGAPADADTKAFPAETHAYVVDGVGKNSLTMHVDGCPASKATATWFPGRMPEPHASSTDFACLAKIPAGKTITIRTPIPKGVTELSIRYTGHKQLVILETSFE